MSLYTLVLIIATNLDQTDPTVDVRYIPGFEDMRSCKVTAALTIDAYPSAIKASCFAARLTDDEFNSALDLIKQKAQAQDQKEKEEEDKKDSDAKDAQKRHFL